MFCAPTLVLYLQLRFINGLILIQEYGQYDIAMADLWGNLFGNNRFL